MTRLENAAFPKEHGYIRLLIDSLRLFATQKTFERRAICTFWLTAIKQVFGAHFSYTALNLSMDVKGFYFKFGHFKPRTKQHLVALFNSGKQLSFSL